MSTSARSAVAHVQKAATRLVRPLVIGYPDEIWPEVDSWVDHDDMWLRRAVIICQVGELAW